MGKTFRGDHSRYVGMGSSLLLFWEINMDYKNNTKKIKEALLKGGLVIAGRGKGKTTALFEILLEEDSVVIIVPTKQQRRRYCDLFKEKFPNVYSESELRDIIILDSPNAQIRLQGLDKNIYIDEYFMCKYRGPFKAAVTSFPFAVRIVR